MTETNYQITADHAAEMLIRTATIPDRRGQTQDKPSAIPCHSVPPRELEGPHGSTPHNRLLGCGQLLTYIGFRIAHEGSLGKVESHHFRPSHDFKSELSEMSVGSRFDYAAATISVLE